MDQNFSPLSPDIGTEELSNQRYIQELIEDYRLMYRSRQVSLIGRREVLTGKAKFGIFGDGKELPQLAMAKVFRKGDIRSGYYRDQTFAFAKGIYTISDFFAQLYANVDLNEEPHSGGRQMNNHQATRMLNTDGSWKNQTDLYLTTADVSATAAQMPRLVGLAQASSLYRTFPDLPDAHLFSRNGQEIAFGTIGNASCAEGHFWETVNAIGVLQLPAIISIWDDDYGISVPNEYQLTKSNLSAILKGFQRGEDGNGYEIFTVKGWDYKELMSVYLRAEKLARQHHIPSIIHVIELTQPQGHSTSGSHERYKSQERLDWEKANDCLFKMRNWILAEGYIVEEELQLLEKEDRKLVREAKSAAWESYLKPIIKEREELLSLVREIASQSAYKEELKNLVKPIRRNPEPLRREMMEVAFRTLMLVKDEVPSDWVVKLREWRNRMDQSGEIAYSQYLYTDTEESPLKVPHIAPVYPESKEFLSGFEILNKGFDHIFERYPRVLAFGEDVGQLGDVNQGFAGLQAKFGKDRIADTGIRETTIIGQAIGLALRGFRPIAEIQYLDYVFYALQTLTDDLACLSYRTRRGQKAPVIIRTRGHRLEGIWHSGSPMGTLIHSLRGIHLLVPRNMTQALGFYHTLLKGDEPAFIIEVLNGYRLKEAIPINFQEFTTPLGVPEYLKKGDDITVVTYGACCRIALEAAQALEQIGISLEVIDVQSLLPFDIHHEILHSLKKTNRIIFMDEDVPGGATAYMMQEVLEVQGGYRYLDASPKTISSKAHRPAYGTDGDYWSKPQKEHLIEVAYELMNEYTPGTYPLFL